MNAEQKAADKLGDVMKLLAQGCHVKVGAFVFKLSESHQDSCISWQWYESYPSQAWGDSRRNVELWLEELVVNNPVVMYTPPIEKKPTQRQVRAIEL